MADTPARVNGGHTGHMTARGNGPKQHYQEGSVKVSGEYCTTKELLTTVQKPWWPCGSDQRKDAATTGTHQENQKRQSGSADTFSPQSVKKHDVYET
ncbi:Hypothetical predicted protein [Pelobates cultripes]|uniref:Uncharacterized protein n=1 Tax=Pelobates cultripes TaxID=61616 RepID=A0AAD1WJ53_PELCU|nr:Hypothetical predicted protein [Pelobates cultripes]